MDIKLLLKIVTTIATAVGAIGALLQGITSGNPGPRPNPTPVPQAPRITTRPEWMSEFVAIGNLAQNDTGEKTVSTMLSMGPENTTPDPWPMNLPMKGGRLYMFLHWLHAYGYDVLWDEGKGVLLIRRGGSPDFLLLRPEGEFVGIVKCGNVIEMTTVWSDLANGVARKLDINPLSLEPIHCEPIRHLSDNGTGSSECLISLRCFLSLLDINARDRKQGGDLEWKIVRGPDNRHRLDVRVYTPLTLEQLTRHAKAPTRFPAPEWMGQVSYPELPEAMAIGGSPVYVVRRGEQEAVPSGG